MKRRKLIAVALMLTLLCTISLSGCAKQNSGEVAENGYNQVTLLLNCNGTEIANDTRMALLFKKYVEERSDGVVRIKVFPNDQLASGNMNKGLEMITSGTTDLDIHSTSIISNLDNRLMVCTMPWLFQNYDQAEKTFFGDGGKFIQKVVSKLSGVNLASSPAGPATKTAPTNIIRMTVKPRITCLVVIPR